VGSYEIKIYPMNPFAALPNLVRLPLKHGTGGTKDLGTAVPNVSFPELLFHSSWLCFLIYFILFVFVRMEDLKRQI
jgi:hypothetical protein